MDIGLIALLVAGVALLVGLGVLATFAALRKRLLLLQGRNGERDMLEAVALQVQEIRVLREHVTGIAEALNRLGETFQGALQRFYVLRYDAFEDMGGKLSFSAAFLDARGDGVVISCINGRQEARTYAKPVEAARSAYHLSPEEEEVIRLALAPQAAQR